MAKQNFEEKPGGRRTIPMNFQPVLSETGGLHRCDEAAAENNRLAEGSQIGPIMPE